MEIEIDLPKSIFRHVDSARFSIMNWAMIVNAT